MRLFRKKQENKKICEAVPFIYEFARKSKKSKRYKSTFRTIAKHLSGYEQSRGITLYSNTFNSDVAEDFIEYLKEKELFLSTIRGYVSKVGYMFRRMGKAGYDVDFTFEYVIVKKEPTGAVYVTSEEIERIYALNIRAKTRDIVRDMFVANCLIGMRFGDFSELTAENVHGNIIVRKTKKTGVVVEVPLHPIVREILEKYDGNFPPYDKSKQNYNMIVKNICKQAKLNDNVLWERTVGKKVVRKTYKRYQLISSHTARRSFATNAYLAGISTARIMKITGHTTEAAFFSYICIQRRENAETLLEHPFFQ